MNYYCYIASLPDIQIDNSKNIPELSTLCTEISEILNENDNNLFRTFLMRYDNENILRIIKDKDVEINALASLTKDDLIEILKILDETENPKDSRIFPYFSQFYNTINNEQESAEILSQEDFLNTLYYDFAANVKNKFVADWFEFNLNVNNLLTAQICRNHGLDYKKSIVGNNVVAKTIRKSNARDFDLSGIFEPLEKIINISEEKNLLEREKQLDAIKWNWLEENTVFNYFSVEKILAFWLRCEILNRWNGLSIEKGKEVFDGILTGMKTKAQF